MSHTKFEIRDYGGLDGKRLLKSGKVINEFGMLKEYQQLEQEVKDLKARVREFELLLKNQHKLKEENLEMKAFLGGKGFTVDSVDGSLAQHDKGVRKEFLDFIKQSENLTGIEKVTVHALWVKFEQLQEQG